MFRSKTEDSATFAVNECEREPIHAPGSVQPYGVLLVLEEPDLHVIQLSENAAAEFGFARDEILGARLRVVFDEADLKVFEKDIVNWPLDPPNHFSGVLGLRGGEGKWSVGVHRQDGVLLMELQRASPQAQSVANLQSAVRRTIADLDSCHTLVSFCQTAAEHFREVTGFDRVMIYRFLEDQSGVVIAESRTEGLDPFLGLHYPASDIPAQARKLYLESTYRLTADVNAVPAALFPPLNPRTGKPLDMSYCALRATSPFHLEYLRNMGVTASLSFSIVREGRLWGLVACHHRAARTLNEETRGAGEILARLLGLQVGIKEEAERKNYIDVLQRAGLELGERLRTSGDFAVALLSGTPNLLTGLDAGGAALCTGSTILCLGKTPNTQQIEQLRAWLQGQPWQPVWSTSELCKQYEPGSDWKAVGSGVLALQLAPGNAEVVFWFRPELVEVVQWAGNPKDAIPGVSGLDPLGPKRSFDLWQEQVRGQSAPWRPEEQRHANNIRAEMSQALLNHRALEISRLNGELTRKNRELESFAAIASHDLQEPLRTISLYTDLLFRKASLANVAAAEESVAFIKSSTARMRSLVTSLLEYAETGGRRGNQTAFAMNEAIQVAMVNLESRMTESGAVVEVAEMPEVLADKEGIIRVVQNLLANALKYRRPDAKPRVSIRAEARGEHWLFTVADNGIGFDPALSETIFEPFRRLHGREIAGSGLGLAISRRIIEDSGGQIWAEGNPKTGATMFFMLPAGARTRAARHRAHQAAHQGGRKS